MAECNSLQFQTRFHYFKQLLKALAATYLSVVFNDRPALCIWQHTSHHRGGNACFSHFLHIAFGEVNALADLRPIFWFRGDRLHRCRWWQIAQENRLTPAVIPVTIMQCKGLPEWKLLAPSLNFLRQDDEIFDDGNKYN